MLIDMIANAEVMIEVTNDIELPYITSKTLLNELPS